MLTIQNNERKKNTKKFEINNNDDDDNNNDKIANKDEMTETNKLVQTRSKLNSIKIW